MSDISAAINRQRAALLAGDNAARLAMTRRWLDVEAALLPQVDALALELVKAPQPFTVYQLARLQRYQVLLAQIKVQLAHYGATTTAQIAARQAALVLLAQDHAAELLAVQGVTATLDRLPVAAVASMAGALGDGSPLRATLQGVSRLGADALGKELVAGVALGLNPRTLARQALRRGLGQSYLQLATIARTETLRAYRSATLASYRSSGAVVQYRRVAAKSTRTCLGCLVADGTLYELATDFAQHPNCRCTLIPVLRDRPAPTILTGQQWLTQQPADVQIGIMGARRWALWQAGQVTLADLVRRVVDPVWGDSLAPARLRDLALRP